MKIITQLVILTLSLLLLNANHDFNHYTTNPSTTLIRSCCDLRIFTPRAPTGVYKMSMGPFSTTNVYCNMTTDGGGWIVIQRNRKDSQLSFDKNWREYEEGFGDLNNDFWIGLKLMHTLTQSGQWEMRVDYQKNDKTWSYLHYNQFSVGSAKDKYQLSVGGYIGGSGDYFTAGNEPSNNQQFSTVDNDNDRYSNTNCAVNHNSGWWYHSCVDIGPNRQPPYYDWPSTALYMDMKMRILNCA